jgi:hypothetical protein
MTNQQRVPFILLGIVLLPAWLHGNAASKTPPVTRDFVKFCEASATDCADAISLTEVTMMFNSVKNDFCVPLSAYNKDSLTPESVNKIKAWIAAHPALADHPTQETLEAAIKVVWPPTEACAAEHTDHLPKITGQFVNYCEHQDEAHQDACMDVLTTQSLASLISAPGTVCLPDSATATVQGLDRQISDVEKWLRDHKELAEQPRNASIRAAYSALYPCKKQP